MPGALEIHVGLWQDLKSHAERGSVILVAPDVDLYTAGEKVAADDVKTVGAWIQSGNFKRPNLQQTEAWGASPDKSFRFVIVQPYVLIQEIGH